MQSELLETAERHTRSTDNGGENGWVLVRTEQNRRHTSVVAHAVAIARSLGRPLRLIALINAGEPSNAPADPVEWDLRRRESQLHVGSIMREFADAKCRIETRVLERFLPEDVGGFEDGQQPVLVLGREDGDLPWQTDAASRQYLERFCASILMVPVRINQEHQVCYKRIVVPLDGSSRAEGALTAALAIARCHGANMLLMHAAAQPEFLTHGPLEAEALHLRQQVQSRNARVATHYLASVRARLLSTGVDITTRLLDGGDARRKIISMANDEQADLIVMASHGAGDHGDVRSGSVASFILEHAAQPVLMVSRDSSPGAEHLSSDSTRQSTRQSGESAVSA